MPAHALCEACVTNESRSAVPLDRPLTRPGPAQVFRVFKLVLLAKSAHGLVDLMHIVAISIVKSASYDQIGTGFLCGLIIVITGAVTVLVTAPKPQPKKPS